MITLDPNRKGFVLDNALGCAQLSAIAYNPPVEIERITTDLAHAIIVDCGDARAVGFRGTACPRDFLTDGKYWRRNVGNGVEVHAGIETGIDGIYPKLVNALVALPPKPLFFEGHSLGGGYAQRFADLWTARGEVSEVAGVYTFGQPRIYNRTGASNYDARLGDRTFRIVFEEDIVARLPIAPPPIITHLHTPYVHAGQEIFLPIMGGYDVNPSLMTLLVSDTLGLYGAYRRQGILGVIDDPLADHAIAQNYVARLQKESERPDALSSLMQFN